MKASPVSRPSPHGVIIGHSNMDLDCLGSLVLAHYLYPDYCAIRSNRIHPLAKTLFNMYQDHLGLAGASEIDLTQLQEIVVVDTRNLHQVAEFFNLIPDFRGTITVYDHHPAADDQLEGTNHHYEAVGANVSQLVHLLRQAKLAIGPEDATIALAGLYADTGNFTHANVRPADFAAAEWLIGQGGSVQLVHKFVSSWHDQELNTVLHELLANLQTVDVNGQSVLLGSINLEHQPAGLAMLVERIFELEQADAIFCVFCLPREKTHLVIARSNETGIDVAALLGHFGGGGHPASASALLRKSNDIPVMENLRTLLKNRLRPAFTAVDLMSPAVHSLQEDWTLLDASLFLEKYNHAGAPVLGADGCLSGMLSLKDIQKGRKASAMHAPVRAYMSRIPLRVGPDAPLRDIETIFFNTDLGRLPVVQDGRVAGIISRSDLLATLKGERQPGL